MKPRSMEEKISYLLFLMGFAGLACTAALCIFVFHKAFREQAWTALEREADLVAAGCAQVDAPSQLETYVDGSLRITLIASDGSVLFESATNQPMENHLSRPEIQQAMKSGVGRDCRDSQTLGYETYYYAMLLTNGDILRVAQDSETIWSIYDAALPAIVLSCFLMMGAAAIIAGLLTKSLVQPVLKMTDDLDHIQENVPYKELIPFAESIHSDRMLRENNEKMRQEFTANVSHELKTPLTSISYISLTYLGESAPVTGSRSLLDELCQNLCDNAIRYNRPGGKVQIITACTRDGHCTLTVKDNGIGIPKEAQTSVFERFYRVDKSRSKATGGTGLGLAIVKHIARIHNARIKLDSVVDEGTTITVIFETAS